MNGKLVKSIVGIALALVISVLGFFAKATIARIDTLEDWRINHEVYSRERMIEISERLARIEEKQGTILLLLERDKNRR